VLEQAYAATRRGGTTVAVGLPNAASAAAIPHSALVGEERILRGSYMGSTVPRRDIPIYIGLWRAGKLPVEALVTGTFELDEINAALDDLRAARVARMMCRFSIS
jgi:alcohol dehydrogenase